MSQKEGKTSISFNSRQYDQLREDM